MSTINLVYLVVLAGALLHATWNTIVKGGTDKLLGMTGIAVCGALIAVAVLPWLPAMPQPAAWRWMALSTLLQIAYMLLVARIYVVSDLSMTYPVMRGTAPMLVALASIVLFPGALTAGAALGIALICGGILCMGLSVRGSARKGLLLALLNAAVIASYTLVDGLGVRASGAPIAYTLCLFALQGAVMVLLLTGRRRQLLAYLRQHAPSLLVGGLGTIGSYGAALWAMTLAPVAIVAALRETSILFGVLLAVLFLRERPSPMRGVGALILVVGVVALRVL